MATVRDLNRVRAALTHRLGKLILGGMLIFGIAFTDITLLSYRLEAKSSEGFPNRLKKNVTETRCSRIEAQGRCLIKMLPKGEVV